MKQEENECITIHLTSYPSKIEKKCLNCKSTFLIESTAEQDFCDKCYSLVCRAVFDKQNSNLTCQQLVEKLRFNTKKCSPTCDGHYFYKECKLCER